MPSKKTKIVATIGPATDDIDVLQELFLSGVNLTRQNFSHGDHAEHKNRFANIKKTARLAGKTIATLQDLSGPKIRTRDNKGAEYINLQEGKEIAISSKQGKNTDEILYIDYPKLADELKVGERVLLNDGKQELLVLEKIDDFSLRARVIHGGKLRSRRGVNFPDSDISVSSITAKDKKDLKLGLDLGFDFIALSFVRSAQDISDLRRILDKANSYSKIVAKIETPQAVENIDEILDLADAIMIARGDLAIEVGAENVPMIQKKIIKKANALAKPVIVATQMLESMINSPVPTRAEVSDISNAILDGADAVMLSEETAMGKYPKEVVKTMSKVAANTESQINYSKRVSKIDITRHEKSYITTKHAAQIALELDSKAIVAFTETGATARALSRHRCAQPIFVISPREEVLRQSVLSFGVYPGQKADLSRKRDVIKLASKMLKSKGVVKSGDRITIVSGSIFGKPGETNTITTIDVE